MRQLAEGINTDVSELEDWTITQRQQIYLAKAILKKPKLLILDEAKGVTDIDADNNIHAAIRTEFKPVTVICLAQRVQNIITYDKIVELDKGKVSFIRLVVPVRPNLQGKAYI